MKSFEFSRCECGQYPDVCRRYGHASAFIVNGGETVSQPVFTHEFPETHHHGHLSIENAEIVAAMDHQSCDVGLQVSHDGRIWLCVNGVAFIRFKPTRE